MDILGVTLGHDSTCALVSNGKIFGIMEAERYFRQKRYKLHCLSLNPGKQISGYQYVDLDDLELIFNQVKSEWGTAFDVLAVQNQGRREEYDNLISVLYGMGFKFGNTFLVDHHLSHAALAFYTSPFEQALVFSYDGIGNDGFTVFFKADGIAGIKYLERNGIMFGRNYNNLGYIVNIKPDVSGTSSGKTMGLSAYGEIREEWLPYARKYVKRYRKLPPTQIDGLDNYGKGHRINSIGLNEIPELKQFVVRSMRAKPRGVLNRIREWRAVGISAKELTMKGQDNKLAQDLVRNVQYIWTEQVLELLKSYIHVSENLCLVGGCALNGITNYAIQQSGMFKKTFLVPNPTDCGLSAGAALFVNYKLDTKPFRGYGEYFSPYLGVEPFDCDNMPAFKHVFPYRELSPEEAPGVLARLIYDDLIVGVIRGRYEVGPRALGNRSILCNPLNKDMRDILNSKVKHREWFRPFAPVVTAEDSHKYFTNNDDIPYMSVICYTRPEYVERLPSITHVDGSARLQTIRKEHNSFLYNILKEFEKLSGMPILLNTSFNPPGEPILNFCAVGLDMLKTTELDLVVIDNTLFCKPGREQLLDF